MIAAPQDSIAGAAFRAPPAAPAGGARRSRRGRGCDLAGLILIAGLAAAAPATARASAGPSDDTPVAVPSGQPVVLHETLADDGSGALWLRLRFVAPRLGATTQAASAADIDHLCAAVALPYLAETGIAAERVVISLSEQAVPFGEAAPGITQYFEAYRVENDRCIWEGF
jgi:hypothetical protein